MGSDAPLSDRRAQVAENDRRILNAARAVFLSDPDAPIAAVAQRANVGISALYRRFASKEQLLQTLALDGLRRYIAVVEVALAADGDPWQAFSAYMAGTIAAGGGGLSARLGGTFAVTDELQQEGVRAVVLTQQFIERIKAAGVLRPGVDATDISLLSEALQSLGVNSERDPELRTRYLQIVLDGLRAPGPGELPSSAPTIDEMRARFLPRG